MSSGNPATRMMDETAITAPAGQVPIGRRGSFQRYVSKFKALLRRTSSKSAAVPTASTTTVISHSRPRADVAENVPISEDVLVTRERSAT
ncbi:hypothetical protein LTS18_014885, partial [Coniosporium uncinatum]